MTYPAVIDYHVAVRVAHDTHLSFNHYGGEVRSATGTCRVHPVSFEEAANPATPHGTTLAFDVGVQFKQSTSPFASPGSPITIARGTIGRQPSSAVLGVPDVSPLYDFGLRGGAPRHTAAGDASDLKIIGRVLALSRRYAVAFVGIEDIGAEPAYHLALTPLSDGHRDRVRDVWISRITNDVVQARIAANFLSGPATTIPWLIHFATIDGSTYIESESTAAPYVFDHTAYDITVSFEHIRASHGIGNLLFAIVADTKAKHHVREPAAPNADPEAC